MKTNKTKTNNKQGTTNITQTINKIKQNKRNTNTQ